jgi:Arc/MetJ family transcription regulator
MQIAINDALVQQTMQFFNTNNAQVALEKALHCFLQANQNQILTNPLKDSLIFENDSISPIKMDWNVEQ